MPLDDAPGTIAFDAPSVRFGDGVAADALPASLDRLGVSNPLLVTDDGVESAGLVDRVLGDVDRSTVRYHATTEPSTDDFDDLPAAEVDGVVAVGGGSVLDTAKVAALLLEHGGDAADYLGVGKVPGPVAPLVAVPTTSGTGSQSTQTAVLAHEGVKRGVSDEALRPDVALVDPALTFDLPREVTVRSGFDAFVHSLESLTARDHRWIDERPINYQGANPVTRPLSRRALRSVHGAYERAALDGDDRDARRHLSLGAHLAGLAFSNAGLGAVHALASTVGGMTGAPHGECLAASLDAGLRYNLPVRREAYADVARTLGVADRETPTADAVAALFDECERIRAAVDLPQSLADLGLTASDVDEIVEKTVAQDRRNETNPREVTGDVREVVAESVD